MSVYFKLEILFLFIFNPLCIFANSLLTRNANTDNFHFDIADLVTEYALPEGLANLEAFKVPNRNGNRLESKWASIGYPYLVKDEKDQYFHFTPENIAVNIKILDDPQKQALIQELAKRNLNLNLNLNSNQIVPLPLTKVSCILNFYMDGGNLEMRGNVYDLGRNPMILKLPFHENHPKRRLLQKRLKLDGQLCLECEMLGNGKQEKVNSLVITMDQLQNLGLIHSIFGRDIETYVLHKQLLGVSQSAQSNLHIEENYEIDNEEFGDQFVYKILDRAPSRFQQVPIDRALEKISKYGLPGGTEGAKFQLSNLFEIKNEKGKESIRVKPESNCDTEFCQLIDAGNIMDYIGGKSDDWFNESITIDDQLREINEEGGSSVKWARDGTKIVPKALMVAKITRNILSHEMTFSRIRKRISNAKFHRTFELCSENVKRSNGDNSFDSGEISVIPLDTERNQSASLDINATTVMDSLHKMNSTLWREIQILKQAQESPKLARMVQNDEISQFPDSTLFSDQIQSANQYLLKLKDEIRGSMMTTCMVTNAERGYNGLSIKLWVPWDSLVFKSIKCQQGWYVNEIKWDKIENKSAEGVVYVHANVKCCERNGDNCKWTRNDNESDSSPKLTFPHVIDRYSSGRHVQVKIEDGIECGSSEWYINGVSWKSFNESGNFEITTPAPPIRYVEHWRHHIVTSPTPVQHEYKEIYYLSPKYRCCKQWDWIARKDFQCGNGEWYVKDIEWVKWEQTNGTNAGAIPRAKYTCCSKITGICMEKYETGENEPGTQ